MSIVDLMGQEAGNRLRAAVVDADAEQALHLVLGPATQRRRRREMWGWVATAAAAILLAAWLVGPAAAVLRSEPVDAVGPARHASVGTGMPVPVSLPVPEGWRVEHDGGYVKLVPEVGQALTAMYVGLPTRVYDNASGLHTASDVGEGGLTQWTLDNPFLRPVERRRIEVDGVAAEHMGLRLAPAYHDYSDTFLLSLVSLEDQTTQEPVLFGRVFKTFQWAVIPVGDQDVLVAATSAFPDDPLVERGVNAVLDSLRFERRPGQS